MADGLQHGERATVRVDGDELEVFDHVSISTHHYVNSVYGYETFEADIAAGDMGHGPEPEAVTARVARLLQSTWHIDVWNDHDIEVVDMDRDDVEVL
ncbi:hypothetical protein ACFQL1_16045 [Halomicroarcula sp. GCM10025709]|uniref:hypothetical protein n=1 Tax=Haloarcula TaxID=2237 RepID=UPI0024C37FE5|nr:hypothetical protein [Halomicroarcula sp. YJ-61-S]